MRAILFGAIAAMCCGVSAQAQSVAVDSELKRVNGHWKVIELIENGQTISATQMQNMLPGGGILEIVDFTVIFKSPIDNHKSTRSFRIDPTVYPKRIVIMDRDATTGKGIYKFDQGKLIICFTGPQGELPTEFGAPTGSDRTLMVMAPFETGTGEIPGLNAKLPERRPLELPSPPPAAAAITPPPAAPTPPPVATAPPTVPPPTPKVVVEPAAVRTLTDTEVRNMTLGTWRIQDTDGSVDIVFRGDGIFQTYRYYKSVNNFQVVFVPTPSSSGNWSILNGRLMAKVTSSTRADKVNQAFAPAVRSISASDMILEDQLGRVSRAVKMRY